MGVSMDGTGQVGTYFYTAPEVEQKWPQINEKVRTNYLDFYLTNDKKKLCEILLISLTAYVLVFIFPLSLQTVYSLILKMNAILLFSK
jgi:ABC-type bacteriocin/lantibiotic exporter with double-glycine peptidase domain